MTNTEIILKAKEEMMALDKYKANAEARDIIDSVTNADKIKEDIEYVKLVELDDETTIVFVDKVDDDSNDTIKKEDLYFVRNLDKYLIGEIPGEEKEELIFDEHEKPFIQPRAILKGDTLGSVVYMKDNSTVTIDSNGKVWSK